MIFFCLGQKMHKNDCLTNFGCIWTPHRNEISKFSYIALVKSIKYITLSTSSPFDATARSWIEKTYPLWKSKAKATGPRTYKRIFGLRISVSGTFTIRLLVS